MIPQFGWSQTIDKRTKIVHAQEKKIWKPFNKFKDDQNIMQTNPNDVGTPVSTNIKDGVSFYSKRSQCNSENVVLLKLVNSNNYPVKVSWKLSPNTPEVFVLVPASSGLEGSCSLNDNNLAKLIIKKPNDIDKKEIKKYALSHINVAKSEK